MELLLIAFGLSADAFAVSAACGVREKKLPFKFVFQSAFLFGFFQTTMAALGYFFGNLWAKYFFAFGHWISFALLAFIGGKMISEAFEKECECKNATKSFTDIKYVLFLALATSIDSFAVGISFSFNVPQSILFSVLVIGIITFLISGLGFFIGQKTGEMFGKKAEIIGGIILIIVGINIVVSRFMG